MGRAEIAEDVLFGVPALLGADHHDLLATQPGKTSHHGPIVRIKPVTVQFFEFGEGRLEVIQRVRTARMAGQLHPLPRRQVRIKLPLGLLNLVFQKVNLLFPRNPQRRGSRLGAQLVELALKFGDRFFEIEKVSHCRGVHPCPHIKDPPLESQRWI